MSQARANQREPRLRDRVRVWWSEIDWGQVVCSLIGHARAVEDRLHHGRYRCPRCWLVFGFRTGA